MQAKIIFTSDMHGFFMPTDYMSRETKAQGLSCLANSFDKDGNTLVVDGGDTLQGSPFCSKLSELKRDSSLISKIMNMAGYDFISLGNHDFNYGLENLACYLNALDAKALCANISDKEGLLKLCKSSIAVLENGLRIGLVGACTHHILKWEPKKTLDRLNVLKPFDEIKKELDNIRDKCDIKVLVYHGGFECDVDSGERYTSSDENQAYLFASELDFDLILTGHQHFDIINKSISGTHVVQVSNNAERYVRVDISFENGKKSLKSSFVEAALPPRQDMLELLGAYENEVQSLLDTPLASLDTEIEKGEALSRALNGSLLAAFINQVQREESGASFSAASVPGFGISLKKDLSLRDVLIAYPYANTLYVLKMKGRLLREYIEYSASYFAKNGDEICVSKRFLLPKAAHYNYDYFSGFYYALDINKPVGERLVRFSYMDGKAIDDEDEIEICVNSYRAKGSGGYDFMKNAEVVREINIDMAEIIINYLLKHKLCIVDKTKYMEIIK